MDYCQQGNEIKWLVLLSSYVATTYAVICASYKHEKIFTAQICHCPWINQPFTANINFTV